MDKVLPDIKGNARRQRKVFSDDGKKRISIVIFFHFTQDVSRIKHRKPGSKAASQESLFLMGWVLTAIYGWMAEPSPLSGFKAEHHQKRFLPAFRCFFLDETWVQSKKLTRRILRFPSMEKKVSL
jgi:hypothetical protein